MKKQGRQRSDNCSGALRLNHAWVPLPLSKSFWPFQFGCFCFFSLPNTNLDQTHANHIRVCVRVYSADKKLILLEPLSAPVWLFWMLLAMAIVTSPTEKQTTAKKKKSQTFMSETHENKTKNNPVIPNPHVLVVVDSVMWCRIWTCPDCDLHSPHDSCGRLQKTPKTLSAGGSWYRRWLDVEFVFNLAFQRCVCVHACAWSASALFPSPVITCSVSPEPRWLSLLWI